MRVVIADDSFLVREGMAQLLAVSEEVDVVAAVGDADELLTAVERHQPDAVITDIRMPPGHHTEGIEAAHRIRNRHPGVAIVVLSQHADEAYAFQLLRDGTAGYGYLLKERLSDLDQVVHALRETVAGRSVIDPLVIDLLVNRRARAARSPLTQLTEREAKVLHLMAQGRTNSAIGSELFISESAVSKHINAIFTKLGLPEDSTLTHRRVAAVLAYLRQTDA